MADIARLDPGITPAGEDAWRVLVAKTLGDKPFESLTKSTVEGLQIAAGVPLMVDEGADYKSFRLGLFGLDKLKDVPASLARLETAFNAVF